MSFDKLVYGQQNWDKNYSDNLDKTAELEDTGWLSAVILAPATGHIEYRRLNHVLFLRGNIVPNATGNVKATNIPLITGVHFIIDDVYADCAFGAEIDSNSDLYIKQVADNKQTSMFSFGGVAFYNGQEASYSLGGGN